MRNAIFAAAAIAAVALPASAQDEPQGAPSPNDIVAAAQPEEWVAIAPEDLLVMTLAPNAEGKPREVVIQLMPAPFSQGWVENIRTLARAQWYDGISVNRVQDNYVVQWGDPGHDNPESGEAETKPLPEGLEQVPESAYVVSDLALARSLQGQYRERKLGSATDALLATMRQDKPRMQSITRNPAGNPDPYSALSGFIEGWPVGSDGDRSLWPVHCYGMVGVGRSYSPDTGSGAELYTVIGQAPRHLDRNIALVGRIVSGMEHLSALPRGTGALGFYTQEEADKRTPILSIRVASDLPDGDQPQFEYLSTGSETFRKYADSRANRRDPFFIQPAGGASLCNVPIPLRVATSGE